MSEITIDNSDRTKQDIKDEIHGIFSDKLENVHEIDPFDNSKHLGAWVTLEENDIGFHASQEIRQRGYWIANHESENRYEEEDRQSYLIILEEYDN